jgi:hypothetical protein
MCSRRQPRVPHPADSPLAGTGVGAIRRINAPHSDQAPVTSAFIKEALDQDARLFNWEEKKKLSGQRTGNKVIGIGIGQGYHNAGTSGFDGLLRITPDGKLHVHSGVGNLGTYSHSVTSRVAAEFLLVRICRCNRSIQLVRIVVTPSGLGELVEQRLCFSEIGGVEALIVQDDTQLKEMPISQTIWIERVDHIGIRVRDLDRALNFYRALGFSLLHRSKTMTWRSSATKIA